MALLVAESFFQREGVVHGVLYRSGIWKLPLLAVLTGVNCYGDPTEQEYVGDPLFHCPVDEFRENSAAFSMYCQ